MAGSWSAAVALSRLNWIKNLGTPPLTRTGTGKTLSVICSTLHWLEVERERQQQQAAAEAAAQGAHSSSVICTQCSCAQPTSPLAADAAVGLPEWLAAAHAASTFPQAAQQNPQHKERVARKVRGAVWQCHASQQVQTTLLCYCPRLGDFAFSLFVWQGPAVACLVQCLSH